MERVKVKVTMEDQLKQAFAGSVAGIVSRIAISPLDVIKIRLQISQNVDKGSSSNIGSKRFVGTTVRSIGKEGWRAFWKGNWAAEWLYMSYGAVQFVTYGWIRRQQHSFIGSSPLISGALAGSISTAVTYPLDVLRTRFAVQGNTSPIYHSIIGASRLIYRQEGLKGFYRGLWPALFQIAPQMGIMFAVFERMKKRLEGRVDSLALRDSVSGAAAGTISKFTVYPLDTLRRRLQVQGPALKTGYTSVKTAIYPQTRLWQVLKAIHRQESIFALWRGILPALLKSSLSSSTTFLVYNQLLSIIL